MSKIKAVKKKIAGQAKRFAGEVAGDQKLHDEGKAEEREAQKENEEPGKLKPFGNLDQLT